MSLTLYDWSYSTLILALPIMHSQILVKSIVLPLYSVTLGIMAARSSFSSEMEKSSPTGQYLYLLYARMFLEISVMTVLCIAYGSISYCNSVEQGTSSGVNNTIYTMVNS